MCSSGRRASPSGLQFRVVFVPGMVERRFPSVARPDPLLLDEERESLSPALRTTLDDQEQERVEFVEACAAARERLVLSYPRVDGQSGRERVPSSFLLRAASAAIGARVSAEELARLASAGETSLGRPYPKNPERAVDLLERDLALVASGEKGAARHLLDEAPNVARAFEAERASWMPELTVWDGLVERGRVRRCRGVSPPERPRGVGERGGGARGLSLSPLPARRPQAQAVGRTGAHVRARPA